MAFERANAAPGDNHGLARVRGDGCQVNLAQVYGRLDCARSFFCLWYVYAHVQFKSIIPDQAASATAFWKINGQDQRWAALAHRQDHAPTFTRDRLCRPLDRVEAFSSPGVFHLHLGMSLAQGSGSLDVGEECSYDHLNRLAVQGKLPHFGDLLQLVSSGPLGVPQTSSLVRLHAHIPNPRCLHLSSFEVVELLV